MVVTVQDQLGAGTADHRAEALAVGEPLVADGGAGVRRMVDEHDPEEPFAAEEGEQLGELGGLFLAHPSRRHEGQRRHRRGDRNESEMSPPADRGEGDHACRVAGHVFVPDADEIRRRAVHIGVVVAGNDGYVRAAADLGQPLSCLLEFGGETEIGEIAGHRHVVGSGRAEVGGQRLEHRRPKDQVMAPLPIGEADQPFEPDFPEGRSGAGARGGDRRCERGQPSTRA